MMLFQALLELVCNINETDIKGCTALHAAARNGHLGNILMFSLQLIACSFECAHT